MKCLIILSAFASITANAGKSLNGSIWRSRCISLEGHTPTNRHAISGLAWFDQSSGTAILELHPDKENLCTDPPSLRMRLDFAYEIGDTFGKGKAIDLIPKSVQWTLLTSEVVEYYNKNSGCGFSDWKLNQSKNVSGKQCANYQTPTVGQKLFDIYSVEDQVLRFGGFPVNVSMTNESLRPTSFDSFVTFPKVPLASLERASLTFADAFNSSNFNVKTFCWRFWDPNQMPTCLKIIPWPHLRRNKLRFDHITKTKDPKAAFSVFKFGDGNETTLLLTATRNHKAWKLSIDEFRVWKQFSVDWQSDVSFPEFRFAKALNPSQLSNLRIRIEQFEETISSQLQLDRINKPFFFLNSPDKAAEVSLPWPQFTGGGARDGFVLIIGDPVMGFWSVLLHELVHSYTAFSGQFWTGKGFFPNALFSEGLATWIQLQKIWDDSIPLPMVAQILGNDLQIAEQLGAGNLLLLLDDTEFRNFDAQPGQIKHGYHPGYLVGASIVASLNSRLTAGEFQTFWNQIGNAQTTSERKSLILALASEELLAEDFVKFAQELRLQMLNKANFVCK